MLGHADRPLRRKERYAFIQDMDEAFRTALAHARKVAGGNVGLARLLSGQGTRITSQAISQWDRVPADRVLQVEKATGVKRGLLRPDLYPVETSEVAS